MKDQQQSKWIEQRPSTMMFPPYATPPNASSTYGMIENNRIRRFQPRVEYQYYTYYLFDSDGRTLPRTGIRTLYY